LVDACITFISVKPISCSVASCCVSDLSGSGEELTDHQSIVKALFKSLKTETKSAERDQKDKIKLPVYRKPRLTSSSFNQSVKADN